MKDALSIYKVLPENVEEGLGITLISHLLTKTLTLTTYQKFL